MIPLYKIEEHNEAFYCWKDAIGKGYLDAEGNLLLHVDHHDDMEAGGYFHDFCKKLESLEEAEDFTYNCLGIADFIIPAIYEGMFHVMLNMKALRAVPWRGEEMLVKRFGSNTLVKQAYIPFLHAQKKREQEDGYAFYTYYEGSLCGLPEELELNRKLVLDIDLDYFCWDDSLATTAPKRIEITKEAYTDYMSDRYHPFRILPRRLLTASEVDGRFYLTYQEPDTFETQADAERVEKRIHRFLEWLKQADIQPCMIDVCRSARSGYLPADWAEFVEGKVMEGLAALYEMEEQG